MQPQEEHGGAVASRDQDPLGMVSKPLLQAVGTVGATDLGSKAAVKGQGSCPPCLGDTVAVQMRGKHQLPVVGGSPEMRVLAWALDHVPHLAGPVSRKEAGSHEARQGGLRAGPPRTGLEPENYRFESQPGMNRQPRLGGELGFRCLHCHHTKDRNQQDRAGHTAVLEMVRPAQRLWPISQARPDPRE